MDRPSPKTPTSQHRPTDLDDDDEDDDAAVACGGDDDFDRPSPSCLAVVEDDLAAVVGAAAVVAFVAVDLIAVETDREAVAAVVGDDEGVEIDFR